MERNTLVHREMEAAKVELARVLLSLGSEDRLLVFLQEVLTPSEFDDLALRWLLMKRLDRGETQRSIAGDLKISLCKITRGSKVLKNPDSVAGEKIHEFRAVPQAEVTGL